MELDEIINLLEESSDFPDLSMDDPITDRAADTLEQAQETLDQVQDVVAQFPQMDPITSNPLEPDMMGMADAPEPMTFDSLGETEPGPHREEQMPSTQLGEFQVGNLPETKIDELEWNLPDLTEIPGMTQSELPLTLPSLSDREELPVSAMPDFPRVEMPGLSDMPTPQLGQMANTEAGVEFSESKTDVFGGELQRSLDELIRKIEDLTKAMQTDKTQASTGANVLSKL